MGNLNTTNRRLFLPIRLKLSDLGGCMATIELRDANIIYDSGAESGVERLTIVPQNGLETVMYGVELFPGRIPEVLRYNEYRVRECSLRWGNGHECSGQIYGQRGSLREFYILMTEGIKVNQGNEDEQ